MTSQEQDLARWYEFFRDNCMAAARRDMGIVTHPSHEIELRDMMERVVEDELWPAGLDLPPLLSNHRVQPGTYQFAEPETLLMLSAEQMMKAGKGMGRFKTLYVPSQSLKKKD